MNKTKFGPKQILWVTFLMQSMACLVLFIFCIYVHVKAMQLVNSEPKIQASEDRARTHIQNETDIEQLRSSALHIANASDMTGNTILKMMGDFDIFAWGYFLTLIACAAASGLTIYAFKIQNRPD